MNLGHLSLTRLEGLAVSAGGRVPLDEQLRELLGGLVKVLRVEHQDVVPLLYVLGGGDGDDHQYCKECP